MVKDSTYCWQIQWTECSEWLYLMATTEMAGYAEFEDLDVKAQEEQH